MKTTITGIPDQVRRIEAEHPDLHDYSWTSLMEVLGTLTPYDGSVTATASPTVLFKEKSFKNLLGEITQSDTEGRSC